MAYFTEETFAFLFDLEVHNSRAWMDANRDRYEQHVKQAMYAFVADLAGPLHDEVSPHLTAIPRIQGGSVFQIHRDTRFSDDKTPYKSAAAAAFSHELAGRDVAAPGLYLHLEPGNCFMGGGIHRPAVAVLNQVRDRIVEHRSSWSRVRNQVEAAGFALGGERLATHPRGYDGHDPAIDDLRRTSFVVSRALTESQVTSPGFLDRYVHHARDAAPFLRYLCRALSLPF